MQISWNDKILNSLKKNKKALPNTKNIETSVVQFKIFTHQVLQLGPEKWKSKHHLYTCESTRFRRTSSPLFHWQTGPIDSTSLPCISQWHGDQNRQMQGTRKQLLLDATLSQHRYFKKTVLETEMFSWFWNAHWTLEPFTFSKLVQLMYLQCYLEIQPRRVCQSHVDTMRPVRLLLHPWRICKFVIYSLLTNLDKTMSSLQRTPSL